MLKATVWCIAAGLIITGLGILYDHVNRRSKDPILFNWYGALFLALFSITTVRWNVLASHGWSVPKFLPLFLSMSASGIFMVIGVIMMITAMRRGKVDIVWSVIQTSMIIPFALGIIIFNGPVNIVNMVGLSVIIMGILIFGKYSKKTSFNHDRNSRWFLISLGSFLLVGLSQFFFSIPSYWTHWFDEYLLRIPIQATAGLLCLIIWKPYLIYRIDFALCGYGALFALMTYAGRYSLYGALDSLALLDMAAITYPACQSICILGIIAYHAIMSRTLDAKTLKISLLMIIGLLLLGYRI